MEAKVNNFQNNAKDSNIILTSESNEMDLSVKLSKIFNIMLSITISFFLNQATLFVKSNAKARYLIITIFQRFCIHSVIDLHHSFFAFLLQICQPFYIFYFKKLPVLLYDSHQMPGHTAGIFFDFIF